MDCASTNHADAEDNMTSFPADIEVKQVANKFTVFAKTILSSGRIFGPRDFRLDVSPGVSSNRYVLSDTNLEAGNLLKLKNPTTYKIILLS